MLAASAHLTDRDRDLVRLVAVHRVLTTGQLTALGFGNLTTARHRLSALIRLGLLRRFRPHPPIGSAPWHYVLGPTGAAMLGVEDRDEKRWAPHVRADRQLAMERSGRLAHMTGWNWFFAALARHARQHGTAPTRTTSLPCQAPRPERGAWLLVVTAATGPAAALLPGNQPVVFRSVHPLCGDPAHGISRDLRCRALCQGAEPAGAATAAAQSWPVHPLRPYRPSGSR